MIDQFKECVLHFRYLYKICPDSVFWIAGGALRDYFLYNKIQPETDIDIFTRTDNDLNILKEDLLKHGFVLKLETDYAFHLEYENQEYDLVKIHYDNPRDCIQKFDFTICSCAVDIINLYHHDRFFIDLLTKKLNIIETNDAIGTLVRIKKYLEKGFTMPNSEFAKIIDKIDYKRNVPNRLQRARRNYLETYRALNPSPPSVPQQPIEEQYTEELPPITEGEPIAEGENEAPPYLTTSNHTTPIRPGYTFARNNYVVSPETSFAESIPFSVYGEQRMSEQQRHEVPELDLEITSERITPVARSIDSSGRIRHGATDSTDLFN